MEPCLRLRVPILDLSCGGGGGELVERRLRETRGVLRARVNPATETAYVDLDPRLADGWTVVDVIARLGYRPGRPVEA